MPTLVRFLMTLGIVAALIYGAMFALVLFVKPRQGEMIIKIPLEKVEPK